MPKLLVSITVVLCVVLTSQVSAADEIVVERGESVQSALDVAMPGDVVVVSAGEYEEALETVRGGEADAPITLRGQGDAVVRGSGRVLDVQHPYFVVEDLVLDGDYGDRDAVRVGDDGDHFVVRRTEVRRSGRDCVDMGDVDGARFEQALIHHCLTWDGERVDAHGITGAVVTDLAIVDTEIHTFTGDAIQFDPGRSAPGWSDVRIEGCTFWLEPLPEDANGVPAGTVPGENAVDTKTNDDASQATLTVDRTTAYGFRGGLIGNMAAFNVKENVRARFDGVRVWDSEIAFRLRGATGSRPNGAVVSIHNSVVHDVDYAVRYEDDIQEPIAIYNVTIGGGVGEMFRNASAPDDALDVRNLLTVGRDVGDEARGDGNARASATDFVDAAGGNFEPVADATFIDQGEMLADVPFDLRGVSRPAGAAYDPGAYEYTDDAVPEDPDVGSSADAGTNPEGDFGTTNSPDSGAAPPSDVGGGTPEAGSSPGCGCAAVPRRGAGGLLALLVFASMVLRRRRS